MFCAVCLDEANTIYLKCSIVMSSKAHSVLDHEVPVFTCDKGALTSTEWDITTQQVLESCPGIYNNPLTSRVKPWVIQSFLTFDSMDRTLKCDHSLKSC